MNNNWSSPIKILIITHKNLVPDGLISTIILKLKGADCFVTIDFQNISDNHPLSALFQSSDAYIFYENLLNIDNVN